MRNPHFSDGHCHRVLNELHVPVAVAIQYHYTIRSRIHHLLEAFLRGGTGFKCNSNNTSIDFQLLDNNSEQFCC